MRIGLIVLARLSSTRLARKALLPFGSGAVIDFIVQRLRRAHADDLVVATSEDPSDDDLAAHCHAVGVPVFRGSLPNVSGRFLACAQARGHDFAVRINGDNVFADPVTLDAVLDLVRTDAYDFVSNVPGRTFPFGMSIEAVRTRFYADAYAAFGSDGHFEHVTSYLYEHEELGRRHVLVDPKRVGQGLRLPLDTKDDYVLLSKIRDRLDGEGRTVGFEDLCRIAREVQHAVER